MIEKGVVNILNTSEVSIGTGYFVRSDLIMTCGHVVEEKPDKVPVLYQKKYVHYRADDEEIRKAEVLDSVPINYTVEGKQESIVILKAENPSDTYYRFCKRKIEGSIVYSYGYPLGSREQKPAKDIKIDSQTDNSLYLGNSNSVTRGCSGAPLLYVNIYLSPEPVVVGMIAKVFKDTDNNKLLGDSSAISAEEIISKAGKYIESIPETLLVADREVDNRFVYNYKNRIPLIGRSKELKDLEDFCNAEKGQVWWAMVAEGGAGKSRLALELAERKQREGWDVFFVSRNLESHLRNILDNDNYDTLIIVDYILTAGNKLSAFLKDLYECIDQRNHKVKVLIIERLAQKGIIQPMLGSDANMINSLKYRESKNKNGDEGYLELPRLSDNELKNLIAKHAGIYDKHSDIKELYKVLKEIDPDNERPLYAMFIANAYKDDREHPLNWDRNDALEYVCRNEENIWFKSLYLQEPEKQTLFSKIVAYVTFIQGAEYRHIKEKCSDEMNVLGNIDSFLKGKFESAGLVTYDGMKETDYFIPLRPDLVGEYYVLRYFKNNQRELKGFFDVDWKNCGEGVSSFLASAIHDYPAEIENLKIHDLLLNIPSSDLDSNTVKYYLNVLCSFMHSRYCIDFKKKVLTYIDNLLSDYENDRQLIVQYARELSNLRNDQIEEISLFIEKLETLSKRYKEDQEIAIYYGFGLVYLIQKQTVEEVTESIEKLEDLNSRYADNQYFAGQYAIGLAVFGQNQIVEEATESVEKLEALSRRYEDDQHIAKWYAYGLAYLSEKQTVEAATESIEKLKTLSRRYGDEQDIAYLYAKGLANISQKQTVEEATESVEKLEALSRRNEDNQHIAICYARGLADLSEKQTVEAATESVEKLEALSRRYEDDQHIAKLCAYGLAYLSEKQTVETATESIEKLKTLSRRYGDDQDIAKQYAFGLTKLSQKQTVEAATVSIEKLEALNRRYDNNHSISLWYAYGLANLSEKQTVEAATESVEKLEDLSRRYEGDEDIAFWYSAGLANLSEKQTVETTTESVEKLEDLNRQYEDDQYIARCYAKGLAQLCQKQTLEEATESVEKLKTLSRQYKDDQYIAGQCAKGLAHLRKKPI